MENTPLYTIVPLIVLLPLIGSLLLALFGQAVVRKFGPAWGKKICGGVAVLAVFVPFVLGLGVQMHIGQLVAGYRNEMVTVAPWIQLASFQVPFEFYVDPLSVTMVLVVTGVGSLIHLYATGYMADDPEYTRFFTYMNLFVAAMLVLVLAGNLVLLFVGWEGVGLCSYLLIGFWYKDHANAKAANKAFIVNRVGDFGFMLGLFLLFCVMASSGHGLLDQRFLSFDTFDHRLFRVLQEYPGYVTAIALLLFVGACGKSAQFPLYFWLPDAMAGPTPVSALIHAATMVTSGVFLLNRMHLVYQAAPLAAPVIAGIGAFTALFAAVIAFGQTDIKKVLAFSTVSQLGFMFVACGAGNFSAGMFHVVTHAFFKALLFLGAGAVIHAMSHNQDLRNYGRLYKYLPITATTMLIGFLAISGFPGLAGFFSKEEILTAAVGSGDSLVRIAGIVALFTAFLTAVYMARLTGLTFFGKEERWRSLPQIAATHPAHSEPALVLSVEPDPHGFYISSAELAHVAVEDTHSHDLGPDHTPHEVPMSMALPLVLLAIPSVIAGYLLGHGKLEAWLYPNGQLIAPKEVAWLMPVSAAAALLGIGVGLAVYAKGLPASEGWDLQKWNPLRRLAGAQFFYDRGVTEGFTVAAADIALVASGGVDRYLVEGGGMGVAYTASGAGLLLRKLQTGFVRFYAVLMLLGVLALLGYIFFSAKGTIL